MKGNKIGIMVVAFSLLTSFAVFYISETPAQEKEKVDRAISLYQHENYEEALQLFKELKSQNPGSSIVAYYLGLTYKQLQNLPEAKPNLEAAATLEPKMVNAIPELIDVLYQTDNIEEAKKWIQVAEKENASPAQVAFLKGLVLLKEKRPEEAVSALDNAEKLDESLAKTVSYYKGLAYVQMDKYGEAKDVFREIVIQDPQADLAAFANEYVDAIARMEKTKKIFRGSVGYSLQYDDNVILKPNQDDLAAGIGNEGDWRQVFTAQGELNFKPTDYFGAKGGYSFYGAKQFDLGFYDIESHDLSIQPAFYLDKVMVSFPAHWNDVRVNDKRYMDLVGVGNLNNIMLDRDNMAQVAFTHNRKYYRWPASRDNDERDAWEYIWSAGWFYFFAKNYEGFVNVRYAMNYEEAKGNNFTYFGNRLTLGSVIPLHKKVRWSAVGEYFRQDFMKVNTAYDKARHDDVVTVSNMLAIEIVDNLELQLQHIFVNDAATIGAYQYKRNIYSAGVKYEF